MSTKNFLTEPLKVVIAEDDHAIRSMFAYKLRLEGYEVIEAENGKQGLTLTELQKPDLILLDLKMPEMNGDEMLAKLRGNDWGASIRVIVLTNLNKSEAPSSLRFLNVDRYVVKAHYTPAQIVEIVNDVLQRTPV